MYVTDLKGHLIEVTDLDKAIEQTEYFKDVQHIPPIESDRQRQQYWSDLHKKLCALKQNLLTSKNSQ